jgi:ubiquinone/menaquinone biosynthesis C-methylase UbiE
MSQFTERFTGKTAEYAQYRERYDPEIILPLLQEWCGLTPEWTVADVGAGTGMVGDVFRTSGNRVIAVEPNTEMRAACTALHAADASFTVVDGSAERTGLGDASLEMVAVGRALHWFNVEEAIPEFRRILKPAGWVVILASGRTEDGREENVAYKDLMQASTGRDSTRDPLLAVYGQMKTWFAGGQFRHAEAAGEMKLDWDGVRGLTLSLSHAPMPGSEGFSDFERELRRYFDRFQQNGLVTLTTKTWVSVGQFVESAA